MKHSGETDAGAEMLGIGSDARHRLRRGPEQEIVDGLLVLEGDDTDLGRQREDDVEVAYRQEVRLALGKPVARRGTLAPWAVPVAAGVVGDAQMAAVVTAFDMAAEGGGAAMLDRRHDLELGKTQMPGTARPEGGARDAQDVGDLNQLAHRLNRAKPPRGGTARGDRVG